MTAMALCAALLLQHALAVHCRVCTKVGTAALQLLAVLLSEQLCCTRPAVAAIVLL